MVCAWDLLLGQAQFSQRLRDVWNRLLYVFMKWFKIPRCWHGCFLSVLAGLVLESTDNWMFNDRKMYLWKKWTQMCYHTLTHRIPAHFFWKIAFAWQMHAVIVTATNVINKSLHNSRELLHGLGIFQWIEKTFYRSRMHQCAVFHQNSWRSLILSPYIMIIMICILPCLNVFFINFIIF